MRIYGAISDKLYTLDAQRGKNTLSKRRGQDKYTGQK